MKRVYLVCTTPARTTAAIRVHKRYELCGALVSFWFLLKRRRIEDFLKPGIPYFLDSGAYSARAAQKTLDVERYTDFILTHPNAFEAVASLDVIGDWQGSRKNHLYMRSRGVRCIPVYHGGEPLEALYHMLDEEDHIALGGMAQRSHGQRVETQRWLEKVWRELDVRAPGIRVHAFGVTSPDLMLAFPWHSVDSSSWLAWTRFGSGGAHIGAWKTIKQADPAYFRATGMPPKRSYTMKEVIEIDVRAGEHLMRFVEQHAP